jgi:sec-independent protein translocase protein TatA
MFGLGTWEIVVIVLVILLLFGGSAKLPELARSLGKSIREFKKAMKDTTASDDDQDDDSAPPGTPPS